MPKPLVSNAASFKTAKRSTPAALAVAFGIFLSRIAGLLRERVFANYLGTSAAAGAFRVALRIPNFLQNLFGEGVLSASFIPVYARLLEEKREVEAAHVASVIFSLLALAMALLVALGLTFTDPLIEFLAPGFSADDLALTKRLVVIIFPGTALLVMSAWCLGILNSHRRFFLSYVAPVIWNLCIISTLFVMGHRLAHSREGIVELVVWVAWSTVAGAALQFLMQLPLALKLNRGLRPSLSFTSDAVKKILWNFLPALSVRGSVQISAFIDQLLASYLGTAAVAAMGYAQILYTLPVSLFGMAISVTELTEMARTQGSQAELFQRLLDRLTNGLRRLAFYTVPSAVAFLVLGDVLIATVLQTGDFKQQDVQLVWYILAGSAIGLVSSTQSRLCVSVFWALSDTRTPLRFSLIRVGLTAVLGALAVFPLRTYFNLPLDNGAAALTASAGLAGWVEFFLIRRALVARMGPFSLSGKTVALFWLVAIASSLLGFALNAVLPPMWPWLRGILVLVVYGTCYLGTMFATGNAEARQMARPILKKLGR